MYKAEKRQLSPKTIADFTPNIRRFIELHGDLRVRDISRRQFVSSKKPSVPTMEIPSGGEVGPSQPTKPACKALRRALHFSATLRGGTLGHPHSVTALFSATVVSRPGHLMRVRSRQDRSGPDPAGSNSRSEVSNLAPRAVGPQCVPPWQALGSGSQSISFFVFAPLMVVDTVRKDHTDVKSLHSPCPHFAILKGCQRSSTRSVSSNSERNPRRVSEGRSSSNLTMRGGGSMSDCPHLAMTM